MDVGKTIGLCGTFDFDVSNDLIKIDGLLDFETGKRPDFFIDSWRWVSQRIVARCLREMLFGVSWKCCKVSQGNAARRLREMLQGVSIMLGVRCPREMLFGVSMKFNVREIILASCLYQ
jgi:hypothetical protein